MQCLAFQATIIIDRSDKEAKRKQIEREALELKSALKVKGSKAEAVLLQQQLGVNNLCHGLCPGRKEPKKAGWCVVTQAKDKACSFCWDTLRASSWLQV